MSQNQAAPVRDGVQLRYVVLVIVIHIILLLIIIRQSYNDNN